MKIAVDDNGTTARAATAMRDNGQAVRAAMLEAGEATAQATQAKCREDISAAGRFGSRWTERLKSSVRQTDAGVEVVTTFDGELWRTFQTGKVVHGKPLLWIPLSFTDAARTRAADYPGELVRVDRAGGKSPLLISTSDHQPKYVGKESVTIPKKFHLVEIAQQEAAGIGKLYEDAFARITK